MSDDRRQGNQSASRVASDTERDDNGGTGTVSSSPSGAVTSSPSRAGESPSRVGGSPSRRGETSSRAGGSPSRRGENLSRVGEGSTSQSGALGTHPTGSESFDASLSSSPSRAGQRRPTFTTPERVLDRTRRRSDQQAEASENAEPDEAVVGGPREGDGVPDVHLGTRPRIVRPPTNRRLIVTQERDYRDISVYTRDMMAGYMIMR